MIGSCCQRPEKPGPDLKKHFKDAQQHLKANRGPTMQQSRYHHANHLAQQLRTNIQQRDKNILTYIQTAMETNSIPSSIALTEISEVTDIQHQANATSTRLDPIQLEILKLLQQIQQMLTLI